ncbi:MAG: hypothetical protein U0556_16570 [Dehalococcoidia bacterium]
MVPVIPGDGIGPKCVDSTVRIVEATGASIVWAVGRRFRSAKGEIGDADILDLPTRPGKNHARAHFETLPKLEGEPRFTKERGED